MRSPANLLPFGILKKFVLFFKKLKFWPKRGVLEFFHPQSSANLLKIGGKKKLKLNEQQFKQN